MSYKKFRILLALIFIFSILTCLGFNKLNIKYLAEHPIEQGNTKTLIHNSTIYSIDNFWYINPIINYIKNNSYEVEEGNDFTKVRRTPGYPIFYGLHYYIFGEVLAHKILGYSQSFLFAVSVVLLGLGVFYFSSSYKLSLLSSFLYSLCPFVIGYTFFTITEALYPAFVVASFFFMAVFYKYRQWYWGLTTGIFISISALIRPTNILLVLPFIFIIGIFIWRDRNIKKLFLQGSIAFAGLLIPLIPWIYRNYKVSDGELIVFEKFYHESPMGLGRSQTYLSKWWMGFANPRPEVLVFKMINSNKLPIEERYTYLREFTDNLPKHVYEANTKSDIFEALKEMQDCYALKQNVYGASIKILKPDEQELSCEFSVKQRFSKLENQYQEAYPFRYYIYTPLFVRGREFIFQSFSSMYGSLNPSNQNFTFWQKAIKAGFYILNVSLFLALLFNLFLSSNKVLTILSYSFIIALFIAVVYLVHIEARYLLAAYPFLYILLANIILEGTGLLTNYFLKRKS